MLHQRVPRGDVRRRQRLFILRGMKFQYSVY
jgi:hypothetical protein